MAKKEKKTASKHGNSNAYIFAAILLLIVTLSNMFLMSYLYGNIRKVNAQTGDTMNCINTTRGQLGNVNETMLMLIGQIGVPQENAAKMGAYFGMITEQVNRFENFDTISDETRHRFAYAKTFIKGYQDSINVLRDKFMETSSLGQEIAAEQQKEHPDYQLIQANAAKINEINSEMDDMYTQDIYPMQVTAGEMLVATIELNSIDSGKKTAALVKVFIAVEAIMASVLILGEVAIFIIARYAKRQRLELEEREKNLQEVGARLKSTRQKASDLAVTNILTGMKNRYALDSDISERLESDRFNIAVFDMDNFRIINDTYGYDFGDEYLVAIAEKLKQEFSESAEIYNISGNEFCFVFNREITESQVMGIIQNIQAIMSSPFTVLNLTVQLTVSGAFYHYLPGDCLNLNSLLVKLDTTMRNAKMNGGNMINTVVNM